jgi:hypothetical protein
MGRTCSRNEKEGECAKDIDGKDEQKETSRKTKP